jgi:hypothetical protein
MKTTTKQKGMAAQSVTSSLVRQEQLWLTHLDAAQQCWNKISRAELLQSEGMPHRLSRLLQVHYDLSREQADYQINSFEQSCTVPALPE